MSRTSISHTRLRPLAWRFGFGSALGFVPGLVWGLISGLVATTCLLPDLAYAQAGLPLAERIKQCATCHGDDGNSRIENIPSLAGQPAFFVLNQLFLMREGVRQIEAMAPFVKELTDADLDGLAAHFSKLPVKRSAEPVDPDLVKRGAELAARMRCASCHLPTLAGQEQMPRLAGQRIDYLLASMKSYRDNVRTGADTAMTAVIIASSDADLAALAHYAATK